jgi:hypothetical protein
MGWEARRNGYYFYRKQRQNGRVVSEYIGAGDLAQLRLAFDEEHRQARALLLALGQQQRQQDAAARRQLNEITGLVREAVAVALRAAGYHQHKRQWRRRRVSTAVATKDDAVRMVDIAKRLDDGKAKPGELTTFRADLERIPDAWRVFGDLSSNAERSLMKSAGLSVATSEALTAGMRQVRRNLGYEEAPALERMCIESISLSWLRLSIAECQAAQALGGNSIGAREHWDKMLSSAQRRHLRAVETLARVRRLLRPVLQLNVGQQQVNVAGNINTKE